MPMLLRSGRTTKTTSDDRHDGISASLACTLRKLGLTFVADSEPPVVKAISDDGLAARATEIKVGLILTHVQGVDVSAMSHDEAKAEIKNASLPLALSFTKPSFSQTSFPFGAPPATNASGAAPFKFGVGATATIKKPLAKKTTSVSSQIYHFPKTDYAVVRQALRNYEQFHDLEPGQATLDQVQGSSAEVSGWYSFGSNNDSEPCAASK